MNSFTIIGVTLYFLVGWVLSDLLTKDDDKEEVVMFTFLFWPIYIIVLVGMLALAILMIVTVLITKLISPFFNKGDKSDGAV